MEFYDKYRHVGVSFLAVPSGWKPIVKQAIIDIEKQMWPRYIPMFLKHWIHYLATDNSVVRVKYWWAYHLRTYLTGGQIIMDIKEKYATLRIYGIFNDKCEEIIHKAEIECSQTCSVCSSKRNVGEHNVRGWWTIICDECLKNGKDE